MDQILRVELLKCDYGSNVRERNKDESECDVL